MTRRPNLTVLRGAALLTLGALAVHQLRYLIAFGPASGEALHQEGHGYLAAALPVLVAMAAATLAAACWPAHLPGFRPGRNGRFAARQERSGYAGALLLVYAAQELAEGALRWPPPGRGVVGVAPGSRAPRARLRAACRHRRAGAPARRRGDRPRASTPAVRPARAAEPPPLPRRTAATPLAATPARVRARPAPASPFGSSLTLAAPIGRGRTCADRERPAPKGVD